MADFANYTFTGTNGSATGLTLHTSFSAGTAPTIQDNNYQINSTGINEQIAYASESAASADYTVKGTIKRVVTPGNPSRWGVGGRISTGTPINGVFLTYQGDDAKIHLVQFASGSKTEPDFGSWGSFDAGEFIYFELVFSGSTITSYAQAIGGSEDGKWFVGANTWQTTKAAFDTRTTSVTTNGKIGVYSLDLGTGGDQVVELIGNEAGPTGFTLTADQGSYLLTGQTAGLFATRTITAAQGSYTLTGQDAGLTKQTTGAFTLIADQGSYSLTGQNATLSRTTAGAFTLTADSGSYLWTGQDALSDYAMNAGYGIYNISGQDVTFNRTTPTAYSITCDSGLYSLTGRSAQLRWSSEVIVTNGAMSVSVAIRIGI